MSDDLPTWAEPYVIAEEFCGDCGESIGYDVRPLTLRCDLCEALALLTAPAPGVPGLRGNEP